MSEEIDHWETTAGISTLFRVPAGTVYRWASEDRWRRRGTRRNRRWNVEDAQESHDRRRAQLDNAADQHRR